MSSEHSRLHARIITFAMRGHFTGRRVVLIDPDDASGRTRNVYEDLDVDPGEERMALVTIYPEYAQALARGADTDTSLVTLTHLAALADMRKMIDLFGYRVASIDRDILS